jgi:hypothetical protein
VPVHREATDPMLEFQSDINRTFENFWRGLEVPMLGVAPDWRLSERSAGRYPRDG